MSALQRQQTAFEHCNTFFSQGHCRFYHPPHTQLGPAEPAEYGRRFQSHTQDHAPLLSLLGCPGQRARENADFCMLTGTRETPRFLGTVGAQCLRQPPPERWGWGCLLHLLSSREVYAHSQLFSPSIKDGNDLFLQTHCPLGAGR